MRDFNGKQESFVITDAGMVRVIRDWRSGTRRVRAFLKDKITQKERLITDEQAEALGVDMSPDMGERPSAMGY